MNKKNPIKTETAAIKTLQSPRAAIGCQQAGQTIAVRFRRAPAFAPLHRFINRLLAEASGRME